MANPFRGDDVDPFSGVRDKEGNIKQVKEKGVTKQIGLPRTAKLSPFGLAFDTARKAGSKTFEFKGKKYTTEMAKPKPKAKPAKTKVEPAKSVSQEKFIPGVDETYPDETQRGARGPNYTEKMRKIVDEMRTTSRNKSAQEESGPFKKGGSVKESAMMKKMGRGMTKAAMQKVASKVVKGHEKRMHGMAKGGSVSASKRADGCAVKGKTRGRMV